MPHRHPAELLFVRHAESQANRDKSEITQGKLSAYPAHLQAIRDADVPLTSRGVEQARVTGQHLSTHTPLCDAYYVSPWLRTRTTFEHIVAAYPAEHQQELRQRLSYEERLRECEKGVLNWLTPAQIAERYPEEAHRRAVEGEYYYRPSGGESWADVSARLAGLLEVWSRMHANERLCIVAHSTVLVCFRKILLRLDEQATFAVARHELPHNCALARFKSTRQPDAPYRPAASYWRMEEWDHVTYGTELASVVPDHQQRQARPGENI